ncbi:MAG: HDOD domain-containing protein [Candidatus Nitrotoga sp.]
MSTIISKNEVIARLHQLPSLPLIVQEVIASFSVTDLDTTLLAHKIMQDQGLCAKVLRVSNSSFYGMPRKIGPIKDAVTVLGFNTVRSLVLSAGMVQIFPPSIDSSFDRQNYWRRSFRVAAYSSAPAQCFRMNQETVFTAGMFHDIGQLVLDLCMPQEFAELQQQAITDVELIEIERSVLGFDHAEIGADMMQLWNFPQEIERVVRDWRWPAQREAFDPILCLVHIATLLENGEDGEQLIARLSDVSFGRMQMTWERIEAYLPQSDQLEAAASLTQIT